MTKDEANAIYDILVRECGAEEGDDRHWNGRDSFVREFTKDRPTIEYRFQGALGFGGKFYPDRLRVSCYPEDETPERREMVRRANEALRALVSGHVHQSAFRGFPQSVSVHPSWATAEGLDVMESQAAEERK